MKYIHKIILATFIGLAIIALITAYQLQTVYNPFTGKLDYTVTSNFSGDNITADYYFGDGSKLTGIDVTDIWVNETGDTMTGNLNMSSNNITNVGYIKVTNTTTIWNIYTNSNGTLVFEK